MDYPIAPVPFYDVTVQDAFWLPRLETNRGVTLPYNFQKCEETGRISNFDKAAGVMDGAHEGIHFNDSDVFKVMEGAAYSLRLQDDPELDAYLDGLIAKIAAAQEADGYLYTIRTIDPDHVPERVGATRWSSLWYSHELYNVGHMYEAAVAHFLATGKRSFLDVALKNANLIVDTFGPDGIHDVPGHQEIEIGLIKLFRVTGEQKYLDLAKFFLDQRGQREGRIVRDDALLRQDHLPVTEQDEAVGHAVRAGYMYSGMTDVAALTRDADYVAAIDRLWENVVFKKMYVTGGIGSRHEQEVFGDAYELPNASAYCETCAAIANAMWNHRMFLLHGDAKYLDVLERVLYNGFLSGVSFSGKAYFYPNPLASDGEWAFNKGGLERQPWFGCSCCPTNVVRFLPSLPGYVYAVNEDRLFVNLFVGGAASLSVAGQQVGIVQEADYPWSGDVRITVTPERAAEWTLCVRIPGWARNRPVPSDLYRYADVCDDAVKLTVNGQAVALDIQNGFAVLSRTWQAGDVVKLTLPMPIRAVLCHDAVEENAGRAALERGPLVYCVEGVDHGGSVASLRLPMMESLDAVRRDDLLNGVVVLTDGDLTAIPYYAWCHRGANEMAVWLERQ